MFSATQCLQKATPMQDSARPPAQSLPLLDQELVARLKREGAEGIVPVPRPAPPDRQETTWYRLVTAISSTYVYVVAHTTPEPCRFEIDPSGMARCLLSDELQWELQLPEAAYSQFELVVAMWRNGELGRSLQVESVRLDEPCRLNSGVLSVGILPSMSPNRRTETMARRTRRR
jgi:hypothetical protein